MKKNLFIAALALLAISSSAFAADIEEIMHSNAYYGVASSIGLSASVLEHAAIRDTEFAVQMNLLEKHNPKLYQKFLTARSEYLQNRSSLKARKQYANIKKSAAKFTKDIRIGKMLQDTTHYERLTLKNLHRLKVGARVWGAGALGILTYVTYDSLANMIQSKQGAKIKPVIEINASDKPTRPEDIADAH